MSETSVMRIAVGDQVRVRFHPPYPMQSFCEGTVSRVDVTTREGRFFVVDVTHEVILDREHSIRRGFRDFIRYECPNDFPGRIELLSTTKQEVERNLASDPRLGEPPDEPDHDADEQRSGELDIRTEPETEQPLKADANSEPAPVAIEPQPVPKHGGLLAALFGRGR